MKSVKEISKWLKKEVEFLKENEDYCGGWLKLDDTYAAVVLWEEGWGTEPRDDVMQSKESPDWALCAGVKIFNPADTVDGWLYPSNKKGDILCDSAGITPDEDYDKLAKWIVDCYDVVKDFVPDEDGVIDVVEESLNDDEEIGVKSGTLTPEKPAVSNNKDDAKANTNQRLTKNSVPNNKGKAKESLNEDDDEEGEVEDIAISSKEAAFDVLKKILDIHCEKGKCTIALKGTLDDEDEVKLYTELSEEDVESLCPEFHNESSEDEEIKFSDESDEVELATIGSDEDAGEIYDFSDFEDEEPILD